MTDTPQTIAIIVALDEQNAIGSNGDLLCHLPSDLKHFKKITTGYAVIMGRKTYESLPKGALPNRTNIVITSGEPENYPGCTVVRSVEEALSRCSNQGKAFIIGGGKLYRSTLHLATQLYLTRLTMRILFFRKSLLRNGNSLKKSRTRTTINIHMHIHF